MNIERKIMMMFICQYIVPFEKFLRKKSIKFNQKLADLLLAEARVVSSVMDCHISTIVSEDTIDSMVAVHNLDFDVSSEIDIKGVYKLCHGDILLALDEASHIDFGQDDEIVSIVYKIKDKNKIDEIIRLIELLEYNYEVLKQCLQDVCDYDKPMSSDKFNLLCAEFTLKSAPLFSKWLHKIDANNQKENKAIVLSWCNFLVTDARILKDIFGPSKHSVLH